MVKRVIVAFVPGVLTSLIASWLLNAWSGFGDTMRLLVSAGIGVLTFALLIVLIHDESGQSPVLRVASHLRSRGNVQVKGVSLERQGESASVASDIRSKSGDVQVSDIEVKRGSDRDA